MSSWTDCKSLLCIRPDNMGDLIMTGPAIRALKETFECRITVLTSSSAAGIAQYMPEIDEVMLFEAPWVKNEFLTGDSSFNTTVNAIKQKNFDGAVIFTVYSQNPLPSVMLAYLASVPLRLAYCRENPYQLLTDWVPDREPYSEIKHQVQRDLDLVAEIGAITTNDKLQLTVSRELFSSVKAKLINNGIDTAKPFILIHAGVSEQKRRFPSDRLIVIAKKLITEYGYQVIFTGSGGEKELTDYLHAGTGVGSFSAGGLFSIGEFINLVKLSKLLVSVNSGPVHIAAALNTPVIVLYACTNPQHTPWKAPNKVLYYSINTEERSKNEVIRYVNNKLYYEKIELPAADEVSDAIKALTSS